ncbi:MAG: 4Fe-4S dicluster domain-containing protein [Chloroflexi bacterium]|jgi:carbon-monoxide dehydrogenase iron sulfur subunit|nr:4Fe-4S dicluster domain-containing protein [Chloroflexota bacterium]
MKRIVIHEEHCIGCRLCEVYCLVAHSTSRDIIKAFKTERKTVMPRVLVEEDGPISFALQCRQCQDPSCLEACISGAMHRDERTGAIICDESRCVGCWMCIMVCPVGAIQQNLLGTQVASKCDLCYFADVPACVANCPNEGLTYEVIDEEARL